MILLFFPLLLCLIVISFFRGNCCGCLSFILLLLLIGLFLTSFWVIAALAAAGLFIYGVTSYFNNN
ncbi:hypothetical protein M3M35_00105 [Fructilactobacillus myrtifloralis]|uniref:Uncharacterized protein n=1 Tax=Fructilactobacillus myrtifloralis TaxID=2940301 RepID=A0ABY5BNH4_9LACO|nr:hypothetical protein [Fructilactobacillus myrtifloralis]USS85115.1 hypothetical protein M3M35_00105 [Fructilactobacillus myrtifloralis]